MSQSFNEKNIKLFFSAKNQFLNSDKIPLKIYSKVYNQILNE